MDLLYCLKKFGTAEKLLLATISFLTSFSCMKLLLQRYPMTINCSKKQSRKSKLNKTALKIRKIKPYPKGHSTIQSLWPKILISNMTFLKIALLCSPSITPLIKMDWPKSKLFFQNNIKDTNWKIKFCTKLDLTLTLQAGFTTKWWNWERPRNLMFNNCTKVKLIWTAHTFT